MHSLNKQHGFTLIELLIAIVIFAIGVLGVSTLQGRSVQFVKEAEYTGLAVDVGEEAFGLIRYGVLGSVSNFEQFNTFDATTNLSVLQANLGNYEGSSFDPNDCPGLDSVGISASEQMNCIAQKAQQLLPGGRLDSVQQVAAPDVDSDVASANATASAVSLQVEVTISWEPRFSSENEANEIAALTASGALDGDGRRALVLSFGL